MKINAKNFRESTSVIPRTDYPRPQWKRDNWHCLNGEWDFAFDYSKSGEARNMVTEGEFPLKIVVPFCPESKLSGIGHIDFIPAVWYRRTFYIDNIPEGRVIIHFGAVDNLCKVWVNGVLCGTHKGGYTAFEFDITKLLKDGDNIIVVYAQDDLGINQPNGKQCREYRSRACDYTRTTGIYQTVWLEYVPQSYIQNAKITPRATDGAIDLLTTVFNAMPDSKVRITAYYGKKQVGRTESTVSCNRASARLYVDEIHLWNPGVPEIYDVIFELVDSNDNVIDTVSSYFALRDIELSDNCLKINRTPVFMRMILDQGFHPEGVYTAPTDEALKRDIELSMKLGFNGARLHLRVFEDRTLYWADMLGYIVWGEYASGNRNVVSMESFGEYIPEWMECINQYYNHPSVIGWICFNETYQCWKLDSNTKILAYNITKSLDPYRPVIDASGGVHYKTDMFDVHDYEQDASKLADRLKPMIDDKNAFHTPITTYQNIPLYYETYNGEPYWISECGGIFYNALQDNTGWGYGSVKNEDEFALRYEELMQVMLSHPRVCGFCYTQLTDIEQEQNGLYYYDRSGKFSEKIYERIRKANMGTAAIEEL